MKILGWPKAGSEGVAMQMFLKLFGTSPQTAESGCGAVYALKFGFFFQKLQNHKLKLSNGVIFRSEFGFSNANIP